MNEELADKDEIPDVDAARMTFTGHLGELRTRMVKCCVVLFVFFLLGYAASTPIIVAISRPLQNANVEWVTLSPIEPVLVKMRFAMYAALVVGLPYIVYNICAFVFPGLRPKEKRIVKISLAGSSVLATSGVAIAFFGVFPLILPYLMRLTPDFVTNQLRLSDTMSIIFKGVMGFAVAFQFPMVVFVLVYMGVLTPETMKEYRRVAIIGIFIVGALLTPPDPISLLLLALPLVVLYEFSIWVSYFILRRKSAEEDA
ncbi:MAG: twin-arginine translocase subunit TatC [Candidatus Hydrogenedentota bacterium]